MQEITNAKIVLRCLDKKKLREIICINYINENPIISSAIIEFWELGRVDIKYRKKTRQFDENSYSKQKMKEEEQIFIKKVLVFQPLRYYFEEQRILNDTMFVGVEVHQNYDVDDNFYKMMVMGKLTNIEFPDNPLILKKNHRDRLDLTNEIFEVPDIRELVIEEYLLAYNQLVLFIINKFNLKFLRYKYLDNTITKYESSYTRNKIKLEELFLLSKVYQYSVWNNRIAVFHHLQSSLLADSVNEKENRKQPSSNEFLEIFVKSIINEFRDVNFDVADDINFN